MKRLDYRTQKLLEKQPPTQRVVVYDDRDFDARRRRLAEEERNGTGAGAGGAGGMSLTVPARSSSSASRRQHISAETIEPADVPEMMRGKSR